MQFSLFKNNHKPFRSCLLPQVFLDAINSEFFFCTKPLSPPAVRLHSNVLFACTVWPFSMRLALYPCSLAAVNTFSLTCISQHPLLVPTSWPSLCALAVTSLICLSSQVVVHTRAGERLYRISPWAKYVTQHEKSVIYDWVHWDPPQPYIVSDYLPQPLIL